MTTWQRQICILGAFSECPVITRLSDKVGILRVWSCWLELSCYGPGSHNFDIFQDENDIQSLYSYDISGGPHKMELVGCPPLLLHASKNIWACPPSTYWLLISQGSINTISSPVFNLERNGVNGTCSTCPLKSTEGGGEGLPLYWLNQAEFLHDRWSNDKK